MTSAPNPFLTPEHEAYREQLRRFVQRECEPNIEAWERTGELPREFQRKAADAGVLGIGFPAEFGGMGDKDSFFQTIMVEQLARTGSGRLIASLFSHRIGSPPVADLGTQAQKERSVQSFGGAGYLRGAKIERIFRETKVLSIGGSATEIMKDLATRQLGYGGE